MSTITEEKWIAIVQSFNPDAIESMTETPGGEGANADADEGMTQAEIDEELEKLFQKVQAFAEQQNQQAQQNNISVTKDGGRIYVSFNQVVFFDGDSPVLKAEAGPILDGVTTLFDEAQESIDDIRVLGHTAQADPGKANNIRTDRTLASQRAANVVIYIQEHGTIDPAKLISEGIGQWRPIDSNETAEGRARNRRVEMIISGRDLAEELRDGILQYETEQ